VAAGRAICYGQFASKLSDPCPPGWVLGHGADDTSPVNNAHVVNP
jgi:hypothetical protein